MPELPEAETIVRGLRPALVGRTLRRSVVLKPDVLRQSKTAFSRKVRGRGVTGVARRGKNVVLRLDGDTVIAVNLGMTGRLLPFPRSPRGGARPGHPAVRFHLSDGGVLVFDDTRRFGTVEALGTAEWEARSGRMGPEPLDDAYTAADLARALRDSRAPVRSWLLDQKRIAGVGNIYACEALFLAGIHPQTPGRAVTDAQARKLHRAVRRVLRDAIRAGGTTIRDYRNADGDEGRYGRRLQAYGRGGEPCPRCSTPIRRTVFGNRSAFLCPRCQPERAAP